LGFGLYCFLNVVQCSTANHSKPFQQGGGLVSFEVNRDITVLLTPLAPDETHLPSLLVRACVVDVGNAAENSSLKRRILEFRGRGNGSKIPFCLRLGDAVIINNSGLASPARYFILCTLFSASKAAQTKTSQPANPLHKPLKSQAEE
jgi:hypothetical protein